MNILIFGATGRTGRMLVRYALQANHTVTAFVRDKTKLVIGDAKLKLFAGDALDSTAVATAIAGHDAILSALKAPAAERIRSMEHIIAGMKKNNVDRIIAIGGSGCLQVDENTRYHETLQFPEIFRSVSLAHWEVCKRLMASELDWTFVCPSDIPDGDRTGKYVTQATYRLNGNRILTGDLADFMLNELLKNQFLKLRVGICSSSILSGAKDLTA